MAKLTQLRIDTLWENRNLTRKTCEDCAKTHFFSKLDGANYYLNYSSEDEHVLIDGDTSAQDMEIQIRADLANMDYVISHPETVEVF